MKKEGTALQTNQGKGVFPKMCENVSHDVQQRQNDNEVHPSRDNQEKICYVEVSGNMQQKLTSESSSSKAHLDQEDSRGLKNKLVGLDQGQSADTTNCCRKACEETIAKSESHATLSKQDHAARKTEKVPDGEVPALMSSGKLMPEVGNHAPKSNEAFLMPKKEKNSLEERQSSDTGMHMQASSEKQTHDSVIGLQQLNQVPKLEKDGSDPGQIPEAGNHASATYEQGTASTVPQKASNASLHCESTNTQASVLSPNQEKLTYTMRPEKTLYKLQPRRNPESAVRTSQSVQASISPKVQEKELDDGFNWRKYGQKLVKGNVFIRSYYKCTSANCIAKKQVERSYDGRLTDIKYIGKHEHPKPQINSPLSASVPPIEVRKLDMAVTAASEADGEPSVAHRDTSKGIQPAASPRQLPTRATNDNEVLQSQYSHDDIDDEDSPKTKKQRRDTLHVDDNLVKKTYCEARYVVQTISEVDIINDCYRWRKYGQKLVKGNPNPRSYYRCSNAGCPVKKHVERSSHDPKVVITTYEGKHDHDMPGSSSVSQIAVGSDINRKTMSGESRSENKHVGVDMVVHIGAN